MQYHIGCDIGSGMTQWSMGAGKRGIFPSLVGEWDSNAMDGLLEDPFVVKIGNLGKSFIVGEQVPLVLNPNNTESTLTSEWSGSDGWLALLYASLYKSGVLDKLKNDDEIKLGIGIPQILFREARPVIESKLNAQHRFHIKEKSYTINVKAVVVPQASAAMAAVDELYDGELVGLIDVGTYTTDISVMQKMGEAFVIKHTMCGGLEKGSSVLAAHVKNYVDTQYQTRIDMDRAYPLLDRKKIIIKGKTVDLAPVIEVASANLAHDILAEADRAFKGGSELEVIALVGGGGKYIKKHVLAAYEQSFHPKDSEWAVVDGLYKYSGGE
jgi:hypothetical protein